MSQPTTPRRTLRRESSLFLCPRRAWQGALVLGALAATARADTLSLAQAQQLALAHNADLRIAVASAAAARAQVRAAREFPNPTLSLSTTGIDTDGRGNGSPQHNEFLQRSYDSIVALSQFLEIAGKRGLRQDSARAGARSAEAQRDDARRLLLQGVTQAYITALEAREEVRVLNDSAAKLRREADLAGTRFQAGDISQADRAQIEIDAARFALDAEGAQQTATAALITLEALLGDPTPVGKTELTDTLATLSVPPAAELLDAPLAGTRPDLASAEASLAKAETDLRLEQRQQIPDLTLSAQFEHHPPDQPNSAGLGLSLPLPFWNRNGGAIDAARAAREQAQAQLDKARLQVAADIAGARSAARAAHRRMQTYHDRLLPQSAQVTQTIAYAYEKGGRSLLELLSAERDDNDIRLAAARAQADAAVTSVALAAALNRLPPLSDKSGPGPHLQ